MLIVAVTMRTGTFALKEAPSEAGGADLPGWLQPFTEGLLESSPGEAKGDSAEEGCDSLHEDAEKCAVSDCSLKKSESS